MGWQISFGGDKTVNLDDLAPEVFDKIAAEETEASWYGVYKSPGGMSARLYRVICAAAAHIEIDPPPPPVTMIDAEALVGMLEEAPDISEQPMVNDFPPTPAALESGSTSGALGDSDGPNMSPEPIPSASC